MNATPHFLAINGRPICQCGITVLNTAGACGCVSRNDARRRAAKLRKVFNFKKLRVVPGLCPGN